MTPVPEPTSPPPRSFIVRLLRGFGFVILNAWIALHVSAMVLGPLGVDPASPLELKLRDGIGHYIDCLYMDNGYRFFAPEPNGATLLKYELQFANGETMTGRIPHKGIQPRLLYHRHFMLTEQLAGIQDAPAVYRDAVLRAYARQLCHEHGAQQVRLTGVFHRAATMERIIVGGSLMDEDLFEETPFGTFTCED